MLDRLRQLIGSTPRKNYALGMGLSPSTLDTIFKRGGPKAPLYPAISRVYRVSLDWLWDGKGAPYFVHHCRTDEQFVHYIENGPKHCEFPFLVHGSELILVLHANAVHQGVEFREVQVLSGVPGKKTEKLLYEFATPMKRIEKDLFDNIRDGLADNNIVLAEIDEVNTMLLLNEWLRDKRYYEDDLLNTVRSLDDDQKSLIRQVANSYSSEKK